MSWFSKHSGVSHKIEALHPKLKRTATAWCHNPALADDLVQETMIRMLEGYSKLRDKSALQVWAFRIMHNCYTDHLRALRNEYDIDEVTISNDDSPENEYDNAEVVIRVREAVKKLKPNYRQVISLVDLAGFSYKDVSTILDIPAGTVMSRLSRARQQLKAIIIENKNNILNQQGDVVTFINRKQR